MVNFFTVISDKLYSLLKKNNKVAPAPYNPEESSTAQHSPPQLLIPVLPEPKTTSDEEVVFTPRYTSTGISAEDLSSCLSTQRQSCYTTDSTTLYFPAAFSETTAIFVYNPDKINRCPVIEYTDYESQMDYTDDEVTPDPDYISTTPDPDYTSPIPNPSIRVNSSARVPSSQINKSTIKSKLKRKLTRGKTFLRKMRKPRSLPASPTNNRVMMKRSLPSMPGSFA